MKKFLMLSLFSLILPAMVLFGGCYPTTTAVELITLNKQEITMEVGETEQMFYLINPHNADTSALTWSSNNTSVATVNSSGLVTAVSVGTAEIKVAASETIYATCEITVTAPGTEPPSITEGLIYGFCDGGVAIIDYTGSAKNIIIPQKINNLNVVAIGTEAFAYCNIESIDFSNCTQLTTIGREAFLGCYYLEKVNISNLEHWLNIDFLDNSANPTYHGSSDLYLNNTVVTEVIVPESFTEIKPYTFTGCSSLTTIDLSNCSNLEYIGDSAFNGCTALEILNLSGCTSLKYIGNSAFYNCRNLESVDFSNCLNLEKIGGHAFGQCSNLSNVNFNNCNNLKTIGSSAFSGCSNLSNVNFNNCNNLETIDLWAFSGCKSLTNLNFSNYIKLKTIGWGAFSGCSSLISINLSNCQNLEYIDESTFSNCTNLTAINFANCINLTHIYYNAFINCTSLTSLNLSSCSNLEYIDNYSFAGCTALETIYLPEELESTLGTSWIPTGVEVIYQ